MFQMNILTNASQILGKDSQENHAPVVSNAIFGKDPFILFGTNYPHETLMWKQRSSMDFLK
jgi:predicted TIM-barrel fold metal-dependent hydrolase